VKPNRYKKKNKDVKKSKNILKGLDATRQNVEREKNEKKKNYTETQKAAVEQVMNTHINIQILKLRFEDNDEAIKKSR